MAEENFSTDYIGNSIILYAEKDDFVMIIQQVFVIQEDIFMVKILMENFLKIKTGLTGLLGDDKASCQVGSNANPFSDSFDLSNRLLYGLFALEIPYSSVVTG